MPATELKQAMTALKKLLRQPSTSTADLPTVVEELKKQSIREDAARMAFWALVGDGALTLDKKFAATLTAAA